MAFKSFRYALCAMRSAMLRFAASVEQLKPPRLDVQEQSQGEEGGDDGRAAVAHEGERDAYHGNDAHGHAHVDEYIERYHGHDASGHENAEPVFCVPRGVDPDQEKDEVQENDDAGADEARLLGDDGEDEVRMALRQKGHLALRPLAVPLAGDLAGADRDLRLVRMIAAAQGIGAGVNKGLDPVLLIRLERTP